jgi:NAD-dependent dihydropyrimidine dehydrogenase PreA subunit
MADSNEAYRALQQHLDRMPIGYPAAQSGADINLLKLIFTPAEAQIATHLDYKHKTAAQIFEAAQAEAGSVEELAGILDGIVSKGGISRRVRDGEKQYAVLPLAAWGMYEHQLKRITPDFLVNYGQYMAGEYGYELASTGVPVTRIIPVEESISAEHAVATYDELQHLIQQAGDQIAIQECMCRKVMDWQGKPCQSTDRREVCMSFGDLAELYIAEGWGRRISQAEAYTFAQQSEQEGLVLMPGNQQRVDFMCACCGDCCGVLGMLKYMPRPADAVGSNYYAQVNADLCTGTGLCVDRCPMDAVTLTNSVAAVDLARCIGCGVCVSTCPDGALSLVHKSYEMVPPLTEAHRLETIRANKQARTQAP